MLLLPNVPNQMHARRFADRHLGDKEMLPIAEFFSLSDPLSNCVLTHPFGLGLVGRRIESLSLSLSAAFDIFQCALTNRRNDSLRLGSEFDVF